MVRKIRLPWRTLTVLGWVYILLYSSTQSENWIRNLSLSIYQTQMSERTRTFLNVQAEIVRPFTADFLLEEVGLFGNEERTVSACLFQPSAEINQETELPNFTENFIPETENCVHYISERADTYRLCVTTKVRIFNQISFLTRESPKTCSNTYLHRILEEV